MNTSFQVLAMTVAVRAALKHAAPSSSGSQLLNPGTAAGFRSRSDQKAWRYSERIRPAIWMIWLFPFS